MISSADTDRLAVVLAEAQASLFKKPFGHDDGGYGRDEFSPSDVWSTAEVIILMDRFHADQHAIEQARLYLLERQNGDGGWGADKLESDTTGTALALLALSPASGMPAIRTTAEAGIGWLAEYQNPDGGWPLLPRGNKQKLSTMFTTAHSYEAVAAWYLRGVGNSGEVNEVLTLASHYIATSKNPDSGWGLTINSPATIRHTSYAILACLSGHISGSSYTVPVSRTQRRHLTYWMIGRQHADGSWGDGHAGDIESTSAAIRALLLLGLDPNSRHVRAAIDYLVRSRVQYHTDDGSNLTGWSAGSVSKVALWSSFYAISAIADYRDALEAKRNNKPFMRLPAWRRYTATIALLAFIVTVVVLTVVASANKSVASAIAGAAATAGVISALPVFTSLRKYFSRRS